MTKRKPWYEKKYTQTKYIETPIKIFYGRKEKVQYPLILAFMLVGTFLGLMFL